MSTNASLQSLKEERKLAALKSQEQRESIFKLVVKIISWETNSQDSTAMRNLNKITAQEWLMYEKHLLNTSKIESEAKVRSRLAETYQSIKDNLGFE